MQDNEFFLYSQWFGVVWFYCRSDQAEPIAILSDEKDDDTKESLKDQGYIR